MRHEKRMRRLQKKPNLDPTDGTYESPWHLELPFMDVSSSLTSALEGKCNLLPLQSCFYLFVDNWVGSPFVIVFLCGGFSQ